MLKVPGLWDELSLLLLQGIFDNGGVLFFRRSRRRKLEGQGVITTTLRRTVARRYAIVGRRYLSAVRKYCINLTTLYYVNHQYILHLYLCCIRRCIHRGLYRSRYWQAASHSSLSLLLQYETASITDNRSRHDGRVVNFQNDYFGVVRSRITTEEKERGSYKLKPCTRFTQGNTGEEYSYKLPLLLL